MPLTRLAPALLLALLAGCDDGRDVSPRSLRRAKTTWEAAKLKDYDVEWVAAGPQAGPEGVRYAVEVRGGAVKSVAVVGKDGKAAEVHPAEPEAYAVDGLFRTLQEEMDQLKADAPFGWPKGPAPTLKFDPDARLGYPRSYRRNVPGRPPGLAIDVLAVRPR